MIEQLPSILFNRGMSPADLWDGIAPGTWLIFGIILVPVYVAVVAWYVGKPGTPKLATMGLGYLIGLILALWVPFYIATVIIGIIFF